MGARRSKNAVAAQSRITNDWLGLNKSEAPAASLRRLSAPAELPDMPMWVLLAGPSSRADAKLCPGTASWIWSIVASTPWRLSGVACRGDAPWELLKALS